MVVMAVVLDSGVQMVPVLSVPVWDVGILWDRPPKQFMLLGREWTQWEEMYIRDGKEFRNLTISQQQKIKYILKFVF